LLDFAGEETGELNAPGLLEERSPVSVDFVETFLDFPEEETGDL